MEKPARNLAVDTYRGFVMLLMMAEVLQLSRVAKALPGNGFWSFLAYHQTHVEWAGCSLHDTIQPGFSFLVGVALPYSIAAALAKGGTFRTMFVHALWRSLRADRARHFSALHPRPADLFHVRRHADADRPRLSVPLPARLAPAALAVDRARPAPLRLLAGLGALSDPAGSTQWPRTGVYYSGFLAHWNKSDNFGNAFDVWFLNLFPRAKPFVANGGGYLTLSFIPTLGTMILGLAAGRWLRDAAPRHPDAPAARRPAPSGSPPDCCCTSPASAPS